jgi:hypothetical protein
MAVDELVALGHAARVNDPSGQDCPFDLVAELVQLDQRVCAIELGVLGVGFGVIHRATDSLEQQPSR